MWLNWSSLGWVMALLCMLSDPGTDWWGESMWYWYQNGYWRYSWVTLQWCTSRKSVCLQFCMDLWVFFPIKGFSEEYDVLILRPKKKSRAMRGLSTPLGTYLIKGIEWPQHWGTCLESHPRWLTHSPFRAGNSCGKKPFPCLQGVIAGCGFMWFCKLLSVYPGRLMAWEQSLQILGF